MSYEFTPLDTDARLRNLVYVSKAKLDQLLVPTQKPGYSFNIPGIGGVGTDTRLLETRELLSRAGKMLTENGLIDYEVTPTRGRWLLVRARMVCGTAWPWAGYDDVAAQTTAWWVGNSASLRILAYGHRDHLLGEGKTPPAPDMSTRATWWPSAASAHVELLKNVAVSVKADDLYDSPRFGSPDDAAKTLEGLESYFFSNAGVVRHDYLVDSGVFEMLMRVDNVVEGTDPPTVFGSPIWISRDNRPVPGTYTVENITGVDGVTTVADWDGMSWSRIRVIDNRSPYDSRDPTEQQLTNLANQSGRPSGRPSIADLLSLRVPQESTVVTSESPERNAQAPSIWSKLMSFFR